MSQFLSPFLFPLLTCLLKSHHPQRLRQEMQKAKVAAYLAVLAETKKKEETERRRQQERARKRALILSARIMAEAQERKLMGAEDKPRHRAIAAEKEKEKSAGTSRQTTSHKEPAPKKPAPSASAPSATAPDEEGEKADSKGLTGVRNEDKVISKDCKPRHRQLRLTYSPRHRPLSSLPK